MKPISTNCISVRSLFMDQAAKWSALEFWCENSKFLSNHALSPVSCNCQLSELLQLNTWLHSILNGLSGSGQLGIVPYRCGQLRSDFVLPGKFMEAGNFSWSDHCEGKTIVDVLGVSMPNIKIDVDSNGFIHGFQFNFCQPSQTRTVSQHHQKGERLTTCRTPQPRACANKARIDNHK